MSVEMNATLLRLKHALFEWLVKEEIWGDAQFYSLEEWRARQEPYLTDSLLILTIDGSTLHTMLNCGGDTRELDDLIESFGFYYALGHSWNLGIYPIDGYDYSRQSGSYASKLRDPRWLQKAKSVKARADGLCQDCGAAVPLEAHHCYYTSMREGYEPWEYPLSALRALCRGCHQARELAEIRVRAFTASMTRQQLDGLRPSLGHASYWYRHEAIFEFLSLLGPAPEHVEKALNALRAGAVTRD